MGFGFALVVFLLIAGSAAYLSHRAEQQRQQEVSGVAHQLGWRFDPGRDSSFADRFQAFDVFRRGHSRFAYNILRGPIALDGTHWPAVMGDYHYKVTSGSGKNRKTQTYRFSFLIVDLPYNGLPELRIRRESMFDKLASFVGFDDIDFESAEFSDRFHVKCDDKRFAYDVLHPRMMRFLLDTEAPTVECEGRYALFYAGNRRWTPNELRGTLQWAQQFFEHWPRHLVDTLTTNAPSRGPNV